MHAKNRNNNETNTQTDAHESTVGSKYIGRCPDVRGFVVSGSAHRALSPPSPFIPCPEGLHQPTRRGCGNPPSPHHQFSPPPAIAYPLSLTRLMMTLRAATCDGDRNHVVGVDGRLRFACLSVFAIFEHPAQGRSTSPSPCFRWKRNVCGSFAVSA